MARKQALKIGASNSSSVSGTDTPPSPAASGAMDDLLAKLRAAKPEARDQRDRRRRARLKDRHAVRVASGQTMQDMASLVDKRTETIEASLLSPASEASAEAASSEGGDGAEQPPASDDDDDDVAQRAASLLEGLRGEVGASDDDGGGPDRPALAREDSARVRRRRESAQDERAARRRRRQQAQSASEQSLGYPAIAEEAELEAGKRDSSGSAEGSADGDIDVAKVRASLPVTVVHPPSPQGARALLAPPGEE